MQIFFREHKSATIRGSFKTWLTWPVTSAYKTSYCPLFSLRKGSRALFRLYRLSHHRRPSSTAVHGNSYINPCVMACQIKWLISLVKHRAITQKQRRKINLIQMITNRMAINRAQTLFFGTITRNIESLVKLNTFPGLNYCPVTVHSDKWTDILRSKDVHFSQQLWISLPCKRIQHINWKRKWKVISTFNCDPALAIDYLRHPHGCGSSHERVQEVGLQPAGNES